MLSWYQKYYLFWICSSKIFNQWFQLQVFWEHWWQHICQKRPEPKWFLHHNHTPSCTPSLVVIFDQNLKLWTSPCLPDLVHCDFFMSLNLNISLKESRDYLDTFRAVWKQEWKELWKMISYNISGLNVVILIWYQDEYLHFLKQNDPVFFFRPHSYCCS